MYHSIAGNSERRPGHNLTPLRVWAGDPEATRYAPKYVRRMFAEDETAGQRWHPWNDADQRCDDGYEPALGGLVLSPRKNGDLWVKRRGPTLTVSAGAQAGGVARVRTRDLAVSSLVGVTDVRPLAPAEPY